MDNPKDERLFQIALTLIEGVGSVLIRQLISYCGSAENVFKSNTEKLSKIPGIGQYVIKNLKNKTVFEEAEKCLKTADKEGVTVLFYTHKDYPNRLKSLYDAPALLYYKGNAALNHPRMIGIVGTRQASDYGKTTTETLIQDFTPHNPLIISGLAYGIDIAAHKAALQNDLGTIAVMASGLDITYPKEHKKYAQLMLEKGGWISENPFGNQPVRQSFLARNRIIAGLSDAVIVVESAKKGGALVTAEYANNYNREVFAIPGNLTNSNAEGTNLLIKNNKAQILISANDIVENLNWDISGAEKRETPAINTLDLSQFTASESQVIALLRKNTSMLIDDLSWQSQISVNSLASLLLNLEFQGIVKAMPGKKFTLK